MKRFALIAAVLLSFSAQFPASAQDYPSKPVKIVVTYPPGGGMDVTARMLSAPLGERLKQTVIVENRPGASGMIGADYVAKSAPDGYTLILAPADTHSINPHVYTKMTYDSRRDFVPVAMLGNLPMTLLVNPSLGINSVDDLVRIAREKPGKLTFGSWGIGSSSHVAMEVLKQERKIDMLHVPFTGAAPAIAAVAGGQVDAMMASLPTSDPQHAGGKVRIIGVTPIKRAAGALPLPEAGMPPGVAVWVGILAPAKTPPEIVARLNREFKAVLDDPATRAQLNKAGIEPAASVAPPAEFSKFFNESYDYWGRTVREAKIKVDAN
jgi:tripartite-type tricarboxylate transporter receptor subunit TctC